jgi:hypothetical protein
MKDTIRNPFNITKAVDFSDQEIHDYWVDIPSGAGFAAMAKPTSPMPMLILGGKGSGKTHLMRYFSYPLQRIRHGRDVVGGIQKDGFIGIYLRCGGLNAARFKEKGQSDETWADVFAYYMELWLSQLALGTILNAVGGTPELEDREPDVVAELSRLIDLGGRAVPNSLASLSGLLGELQRDLDTAVNNAALTRTLPINIAITRGNLIFGIPHAIAANLSPFRECLFLYLIDEFENLSEAQQKYVNTLLRERESPCSFKIGARMYGIRTASTYSADEDNKEGSEFEVLRLDALLRDNDKYPDFAKHLIAKRLAEYGHIPSASTTLDGLAENLERCFEEPARSRFASAEVGFVIDKYKGKVRPYFKSLRQHLERGLKAGATPGVRSSDAIDTAIALLGCPEFPLLEKINIYLFYKEWSSNRNLIDAAAAISEDCRGYINGTASAGSYERTLHHFKADLLAQLLRETDQRQRYVGLKVFIEISSGLPRNLLILLKHIFAWATFNGEKPFRGPPISIKSQQAGVLEASEWFYRDARMIGRDGQLVMDSINRLGTLFRGIRFSEKPSECSCSTFSSDLSQASDSARRLLDLAEKWSLLIDVGGQRDRNTERIDAKYQLNRMLSPRWDLPIYRRGVLALTPAELDSVFDPEHTQNFESYLEARIARMSAPFFGKRSNGVNGDPADSGPDLFTGEGP